MLHCVHISRTQKKSCRIRALGAGERRAGFGPENFLSKGKRGANDVKIMLKIVSRVIRDIKHFLWIITGIYVYTCIFRNTAKLPSVHSSTT